MANAENMTRYRKRHPERVKESLRNYKEKHPDRVKETKDRSQRKYYEAHREEYRAYNSKYHEEHPSAGNAKRQRTKDWLVEYKKPLSCVICGESRNPCLDFHHRDSSTKGGGVSSLAGSGASIEIILDEIALCDVLCSNCHRALHYDEKLLSH